MQYCVMHPQITSCLIPAAGEFRIESRLEERIASAFVDDRLARLRRNFRSNRPS